MKKGPQRPRGTAIPIAMVLAFVIAACGGGQETGTEGGETQAPTATEQETEAAGETETAAETETETEAAVEDLGSATIVLGGKVITWAPAYVGVCEGFFEDHGLDVEVTVSEQGTTSAIAALVAGDVLSAMTGAPAQVGAVREGAPVQMLFNASVGYGVQLVVSNAFLEQTDVTPDSSLEDRVQALEGATIAILNPGDSIDNFYRFLFPQYGIDPDNDVTLIALSNYTNMFAAMSNGEIDALAGSPPNGNSAEAQGLGKIWISANEVKGLDNYPYLVGSANTREMESNPERVKALVAGMADAMNLLNEDPSAGEDCLREQFPDLDDATFQSAYDFAMSTVPESPLITEDVYQSLLDFAEAGGNPIDVSYEEAVAVDIVNEALGS